MENANYPHSELSARIIKCFYTVYNTLGYGFLEKVYERALVIELRKNGLFCLPQHQLAVYYDEYNVGNYAADIFVENTIIVEVKASRTLCPEDEAQLLNYLKGCKTEVGLLLNFGERPEIKRKIFSNGIKNSGNQDFS
jgi:GxxExxY protein